MSVPWLTILSASFRPQYLDSTLEALDGNGGARSFPGQKIVMFDGVDKGVNRPGWQSQLLRPERIVQTVLALAMICRRALSAECPYIIYCEDDIFPCHNAVLAVAAMEVPNELAFLAFCNQKKDCDSSSPHIQARRADAPLNAPGHWGMQMLKIPRRTLEVIAAAPLPVEGFGADVWLGQKTAIRATPSHYYGIVLPSLVRHVGVETSIGTQKKEKWEGHRLGLNYAGDDAEALAIVKQIAGQVRMWRKNDLVFDVDPT